MQQSYPLARPDASTRTCAPSAAREGGSLQDLPSYDARQLTAGASLAQIHLDGQVYTLRITKADKLILTK